MGTERDQEREREPQTDLHIKELCGGEAASEFLGELNVPIKERTL